MKLNQQIAAVMVERGRPKPIAAALARIAVMEADNAGYPNTTETIMVTVMVTVRVGGIQHEMYQMDVEIEDKGKGFCQALHGS